MPQDSEKLRRRASQARAIAGFFPPLQREAWIEVAEAMEAIALDIEEHGETLISLELH